MKPGTDSISMVIFSSGHFRYVGLAIWEIASGHVTYATVLVTFNLLLLATAEPPFVNKLWQLLFHHIFEFSNCLVQTFFRYAGNMEIQRRILDDRVSLSECYVKRGEASLTAGVAMLLSG